MTCSLPVPRAIFLGPVLIAHAEFSMQDPFPAFSPVLCTALPGCVLFNTGDSICALYYTLGDVVCCVRLACTCVCVIGMAFSTLS